MFEKRKALKSKNICFRKRFCWSWAVLLYGLIPLLAQAPELDWTQTVSPGGHNIYHDVAMFNGNVYSVGTYNSGSVDFDPGPGTLNLTAPEPWRQGGFIQKSNPAGDLVWILEFLGGDNNVFFRDIVINSVGDLFVAGTTTGEVDFDPGPEEHLLSESGVFLLKLDQHGQFKWVKKLYSGFVSELILTENEEILVSGSSGQHTEVDIGGTLHTIFPESWESLGILLKMDNEGNGLWYRSISYSMTPQTFSIASDSEGAIYGAGWYFDPIDLAPNLPGGEFDSWYREFFIIKYSADGSILWTKLGSGSRDNRIESLSIDSNDNLVVMGQFTGQLNFESESESYQLQAPEQAFQLFVLKLNKQGNIIWVNQTNSDPSCSARSVETDEDSNIYTSGIFYGQIDFDPGVGVDNHNSNGASDVFLQKLNTDGDFLWARTFGSEESDQLYTMVLGEDQTILLTGDVGGSLDFDPGSNVSLFEPEYSSTAFVQKYGETIDSFGDSNPVLENQNQIIWSGESERQEFINEQTSLTNRSFSSISLSPNPVQRYLHINSDQVNNFDFFEIYDLSGKLIASKKEIPESLMIDLQNFSSGMYFLNLVFNGTSKRFRIQKQ